MKNNLSLETEDVDFIFDGELKIVQKKSGYRYNIDSLILADFFRHLDFTSVIDLGCGCGIITFLIYGLYRRKIQGIELQKPLVQIGKKNIQINDLSKFIDISNIDIRDVKHYFKKESFDAIVSNPPFYALNSGRINPGSEKAIARHELSLTAEELIKSAWYLLKYSGGFITIYPTERFLEIEEICNKVGFFIEIRRSIKPTQYTKSKTVMMLLRKSKVIKPTKKLQTIVIQKNGKYSQEILNIFKLFGVGKKVFSNV